jgi:NAD(P)-dependent dehydrogenase (short-subunit alcohol dehydrogenase family)
MSSQAQPSSSRPYVPCPPAGVSRRTALVTGSSSGIGKGIARHLALQGFDVGLTMMPGESSEELEKFANDLETTYGIETIRHEVDFSKPEQACPQLMQDFMQKVGRIDVLVNCAGITAFNNTPFKALGDKLEPEGDPARQAEAIAGKIREGMDVNFVTPFLLSHEAVQHMLKQQAPDQRADISVDSSRANSEELFWTKAWGQGRIINITSVHAEWVFLLNDLRAV